MILPTAFSSGGSIEDCCHCWKMLTVPDEIKFEVQKKAEELIATIHKPSFIKPPPKHPEIKFRRQ